jgi:hypothetical protein
VLQDFCAQATADQIANCKSSERVLLVEVSAKHCSRGPDADIGKRLLKSRGRQVDDGDRVADQRQRRAHALECLLVVGDGEMAGLSARGNAQLRKMDGEPLLQVARTRRGDQSRTRSATADVDQQAGPIGFRAGADERCCRRLGAARRTDGGDKDDHLAHRPAFLAKAELVMARRSASDGNGDGGINRTVTSPPRTETSLPP